MTTTREAVMQYVAFRQAAGADFRATARLLDAFCRAVGSNIDIAEVDLEMKAKALALCEVTEGVSSKRWRQDEGPMAYLGDPEDGSVDERPVSQMHLADALRTAAPLERAGHTTSKCRRTLPIVPSLL